MKFIKKINEFFNSEEEIEREDNFGHDEEEGDFYFDEEEGGHDEEEGDFSHEEENWGDEEDSSLGGSSRISSFDDFGGEEECEPCDDEESGHDYNARLEDGTYEDEDDEEDFGHEEGDFSDEDFDSTVHHLEFYEDEDKDEEAEGDENAFVESFKAFNEKKKMNAGLQAYLDKKAGKKGKKSEDEAGEDEKPDFLDLDKDGNKKESMKKAAKDAKKK